MNFLNMMFGKYKFITMFAIIAVLIIGIIAVSIVFYGPEKAEKTDTTGNTSESENMTAGDNSVLAGDISLLFVCNSDSIGEPVFAVIIDFHIYSEVINITPLDMSASYAEKTYAESYSYGGINSLISAVEAVRKSNIDRYMIIDKSGMSELTDLLGKVKLYVSEDYTYQASDKSYEVKAGTNELEAEMLYSYLKLICSKQNGNELLSETVCTIINSYLAAIDADEAQALFGDICNCVNTDITISDYYTCKSDIEYLLTHNPKCFSYDKVEQ